MYRRGASVSGALVSTARSWGSGSPRPLRSSASPPRESATGSGYSEPTAAVFTFGHARFYGLSRLLTPSDIALRAKALMNACRLTGSTRSLTVEDHLEPVPHLTGV